MQKEPKRIISLQNGESRMTVLHTQRTDGPRDRDEGSLLTLLQKGEGSAQRLSLHTCLLERRLRGEAEPVDLLVLVRDIKFAVEELQTLFRSAVQKVTPARVDSRGAAHTPATITPRRVEVVELNPLLSCCVASVRQRAKRRGISLLCDIASDLPALTTDPDVLAQVFSLLLEHAVQASGKGGLEVRVRWTAGMLVIDMYDSGRGISKETYIAVRNLIDRLQGTLKVTQELGRGSRVELSLPPVSARGSGAPVVAPVINKENGQ
jgi:signal transduction histidine kinase